ncbi:MAG TPA: NAD(P)-dependent oxidoreductase [Candidatus Lokiarchaeia archaeon]|nr:NAD(P)-dependent oxidoreductase [Candidatus Lokiarchaeia archaeon]
MDKSALWQSFLMNILVTGAFGNIGMFAVHELLQRGNKVACFDLQTPANQKNADSFKGKISCFWGDLRKPETLNPAVQGQDVVVHLAAIIPPLSEKNPDLARSVNVEGTKTLLELMAGMNPPPRLLFTSSISVFGDTNDLPPPRQVGDPLNPNDVYSSSKVECEEMIHDSGLDAVIFRLAATPPMNLGGMDPMMFEIRLDTRMEYLHPADVGLAIANAVESEEAWGNTYLIGAGKSSQLLYRDFLGGILNALGVGMLPDAAFGTAPFYTDWLDTSESQRVLNFQKHTYEDYIKEIKKKLGIKAYLAKAFRPFVRKAILKASPYWKAATAKN